MSHDSHSETNLEERFTDFVITKASVGADGRKRWAASVSQFSADSQGDEVTREMYERSIRKMEAGEHPYPALVVSHYDDPRLEVAYTEVPPEFRAGMSDALYIDGDTPKAKGYFEDTALGNATYEAIKADIDSNRPHEERIRISMAWRPEANGIEKAEDGHVMHRKALIRHMAVTRVPIIKETNIVVNKSQGDTRRTKHEDAITIVGEDLADQLNSEYVMRVSHHKSESEDGLIEKAADEEGDSEKKPMKSGKFDMGECLTMKTGEGMDKKQALAVCLSMARRSNGKKKADIEFDEDQIEKQGNSDEDMPIGREMLPCIQKWRRRGLSLQAARDTCLSIAKKEHRQRVTAQVAGKQPASYGKADLSAPRDECVRSYIEDGMSREEAEKLCDSDKAKKARAMAQENEKADLGDIIDKMVDYLMAEDSEVQVVTKADDTEVVNTVSVNVADELLDNEMLSELLLAALNELGSPSQKSESETAEVVETVNAVTGKSEVVSAVEVQAAGDVNETSEKANVSGSPRLEEFEKYYLMLKSALVDDNLDQNEKAVLSNHAFVEMSEIARDLISKNTPASPGDMAILLREALEEAMGPYVAQNQVLLEAVNELQAQKAALEEDARVPRPRQLHYAGATQEKARLDDDKGGALTAAQIAELSTKAPQRMY